jgi:predicted permease
MRRLRAWALRLAGLLNKQRRERELAEELESHLQLHIEDNLRAGLTPVEARRQALIKLGGIEQTKEIYRDRRGIPLVDTLVQDVRYGLRMLRKSPGFTAVAVLTLALGIGANTAIFTLIDALLLKRLPVREPDRLVALSDPDKRDKESGWYSYAEYVELRDHNDVLTGLAATTNSNRWMTLGWNGVTEQMPAAWVSGNYFDVLGVKAFLGRTFSPDDDRPGNAVALLRYDLWKQFFGSDPTVVGKTIEVFHHSFTVIGVLPPGFNSLDGTTENFLVPITMMKTMWGLDLTNPFELNEIRLFGRLKAGVSRERAQASLATLFSHIRESFVSRGKWEQEPSRKSYLESRITVLPAGTGLPDPRYSGRPTLRQRFSRPLGVLMAVTGLVLLIACVNIANLLLARAAARRHEMAVRLALGAGLPRIVGQMLTESFLLTGAGGAIGVLLAWWGCEAIAAQMGVLTAVGRTISLSITPDVRVMGFTLALSVATGCLFGLAPALQAFCIPIAPVLKDEGLATSGGRGPITLRKGLIAAQVALSVLLVAGGGLFIRTLWNLEHVSTGTDRAHVIVFWLDDTAGKAFWGSKTEQREQIYRSILGRVESIPGVRSAALSAGFDFLSFGGSTPVAIEGRPPEPNASKAQFENVNSRYFETLGIPVVRGRIWTPAEDAADPVKVAVINQTMARTLFANTDPVGRHVSVGPERSAGVPVALDLEIAGVVGDAIYGNLRERAQPTIYAAGGGGYGGLYVRTSIDPAAVVPRVRREVHRAHQDFFITQAHVLTEVAEDLHMQERLLAGLTGILAGLAALLAAIGLYGVVAWSVARRTREIGIRVALGASRGDLIWMVVRDVLAPVVVGLVVGMPTVIALAQLVRSLLYGVGPADPSTIAGAAFLMCVVAAAAAYLPARRATKVDPMVALRYE